MPTDEQPAGRGLKGLLRRLTATEEELDAEELRRGDRRGRLQPGPQLRARGPVSA